MIHNSVTLTKTIAIATKNFLYVDRINTHYKEELKQILNSFQKILNAEPHYEELQQLQG